MRIAKLSVSDLKEHPKNQEYFQNISGEFWKIFVEDIRENGIREPLTVNSKNMRVIKGNQRLRAARELGLATVPCLLITIDNDDIEIEELIRDNVLRRDIDVFTKFMLVNKLRESVKGRQGERGGIGSTSVENQQKLPPRNQIAEILKESVNFVSMADLFNALPGEKQAELREWFYSQDKAPTQKDVKEEIDKLAGKTRDLEDALKKSYDQNGSLMKEADKLHAERVYLNTEIDAKNKEIKNLTRSLGDKSQVEKLKRDIEELSKRRNSFQEELDEIGRLVRFKHDAGKLIDAISPMRYAPLLQRSGISPVAKETVGEILDIVQKWVDDITDIINKAKTTIQVK